MKYKLRKGFIRNFFTISHPLAFVKRQEGFAVLPGVSPNSVPFTREEKFRCYKSALLNHFFEIEPYLHRYFRRKPNEIKLFGERVELSRHVEWLKTPEALTAKEVERKVMRAHGVLS